MKALLHLAVGLALAGTALAQHAGVSALEARMRERLLRNAIEGVREGTCASTWATQRLRGYCTAAMPDLRKAVQRLGTLSSIRLHAVRNGTGWREETWLLDFERGRIELTAGVKDGNNEYFDWIPRDAPVD